MNAGTHPARRLPIHCFPGKLRRVFGLAPCLQNGELWKSKRTIHNMVSAHDRREQGIYGELQENQEASETHGQRKTNPREGVVLFELCNDDLVPEKAGF